MKDSLIRKQAGCLAFWAAVLLSGCTKKTELELARAETKNIDPWVYLSDTSISTNGTVKEFAGSAAGLMVTVGVMGIAFSIFYLVLRLFFGGSRAKVKNELKEEILFKSVISIMLFSIPFWLGLVKMISDLLV